MTSERIPVEPAVLAWARESLGLTVDLAASRLNVSVATLEQWEAGALAPTIKQLRKASDVYKRPLAVLLLAEPPKDFAPLRDFRVGAGATTTPSPDLQAEIRRVIEQREILLELAELDPDVLPEPTPLPESRPDADPDEVGTALREWAGVDLQDQFATRDKYEALNLWIRPVEDRGVLVTAFSGVDRDRVAGFSISEWPYPAIAINGADWPRRRLFTLLHELAHLTLNIGGLCDLHEVEVRRTARDNLEHFCNAVAAAALVPSVALAEEVVRKGDRLDLDFVSGLAQHFSVSSEALLLRLVSTGHASWADYWDLRPELEILYEEARQRERQESIDKPKPIFYQTKARNLGHGFIGSVLDAYNSRAISSRDAADFLDVKFDQIPKLARAVGRER